MHTRPVLLCSILLLPLVALFLSFANPFLSLRLPPADTLPAFFGAKAYGGKMVSKGEGLVTLSTGLDNAFYLQDAPGNTGFLYFETKIGRFVNERAVKSPLNIAIVLDRSGSMQGEKMAFAKKAANNLIDKLAPEDFVSVVVYDEFIDVIQPATPVRYKDSIKAKLNKVKPRGSTNLWGGSEKGYEQVRVNYKKNYVNRVLLISDSNITAGPKIPSRIIARAQEFKDVEGISISTFGVGLDYNETLMTDIAENGAGNYYYIDRADKMAAMFDREFNGLLNVVARNAELRIQLPKGVTVEKIYPFKYALVKNEVVIRFQDLFSEDVKALVMQFRHEKGADQPLLFKTSLAYNDARDEQARLVVNENMLAPVKDSDRYLTHFNRTVAEQVLLFTANENMEKAMYEVDRGNYEAARRYAEANGFLTGYSTGIASAEWQEMDSVVRYYTQDIANIRSLSRDSVKQIQKDRRAQNYRIRNKKGQ